MEEEDSTMKKQAQLELEKEELQRKQVDEMK